MYDWTSTSMKIQRDNLPLQSALWNKVSTKIPIKRNHNPLWRIPQDNFTDDNSFVDNDDDRHEDTCDLFCTLLELDDNAKTDGIDAFGLSLHFGNDDDVLDDIMNDVNDDDDADTDVDKIVGVRTMLDPPWSLPILRMLALVRSQRRSLRSGHEKTTEMTILLFFFFAQSKKKMYFFRLHKLFVFSA